MNFFKKIFIRDAKPGEVKRLKQPENTRLNYLLDLYAQHPSRNNYASVINEMQDGNAYLLLPSANGRPVSGGWKTLEKEDTLTLASVYNLDGLKVLGAFSNETMLLNWAQREMEYTAMRTQDLLAFCSQHGIDRIVINSNQKNNFVLERNRENITTKIIEKETNVLVGTPTKPLTKRLLDKLVANFQKVDTIEEAYHYAQSLDNETSLALGICLSIDSDNSRAALQNAINNSLQGEAMEQPLDVIVLTTEEWLNTVRGIQNALFYKRELLS